MHSSSCVMEVANMISKRIGRCVCRQTLTINALSLAMRVNLSSNFEWRRSTRRLRWHHHPLHPSFNAKFHLSYGWIYVVQNIYPLIHHRTRVFCVAECSHNLVSSTYTLDDKNITHIDCGVEKHTTTYNIIFVIALHYVWFCLTHDEVDDFWFDNNKNRIYR